MVCENYALNVLFCNYNLMTSWILINVGRVEPTSDILIDNICNQKHSKSKHEKVLFFYFLHSISPSFPLCRESKWRKIINCQIFFNSVKMSNFLSFSAHWWQKNVFESSFVLLLKSSITKLLIKYNLFFDNKVSVCQFIKTIFDKIEEE